MAKKKKKIFTIAWIVLITFIFKPLYANRVDVLIDKLKSRYWFERVEAIRALVEMGDPAVEPLIKCLDNKNLYVREVAAVALGKIGDVRAIEPLIRCLNDDYWWVRIEAGCALVKIGEPAVETLIQYLKDENPDVREQAMEVLTKIKDPRAIGPLIQCLKDDYQWIRIRAADALVKTGEPAVESLIQCLKDKDPDVQEQAVEILGNIRDARAVAPLIHCLKNKEWGVRKQAADALYKIGKPAAKPLIQCLKDEDGKIRGKAAEILGNIGWTPKTVEQEILFLIAKKDWINILKYNDIAVAPLIQCLRDEDLHIRKNVAWTLGKIGSAYAIDSLIQCLQDKESSVRRKGIEALGEIGDSLSVKVLIQCLLDKDWAVRKEAACSLGKIKDSPAIKALIYQGLNDRYELVREEAVNALVKIGTPAVGPLIQSFNYEEFTKLDEVAKVLVRIGSPAMDPLVQCLKNDDLKVRKRSAVILENMNWAPITEEQEVSFIIAKQDWNKVLKYKSIALEQLIMLLKDKEVIICRKAIWALGEIGDSRAVDPIIHCLGDKDPDVRREAVWSLGKIGDSRGVEALIKCLKKSQLQVQQVQRNAADALVKIGKPSVSPLIQCLRDESIMSKYVIVSLGRIGDARAVKPLILGIRDNNFKLFKDTVEALVKIGKPSVGPLIQCLKEEGSDADKLAIEALTKIGDPSIKPLIQCLWDKDYSVRMKAAKTLEDIGWAPQTEEQKIFFNIAKQEWKDVIKHKNNALVPLIQCLKNENPHIRQGAIWALGEIRDKQAVEVLIRYLKDENTQVRRNIAEALGKTGDTRAVEDLIRCSEDEDQGVRINALGALGEIGDKRAIEHLIQGIQDKNIDIRKKAAWALIHINQSFGEWVITGLKITLLPINILMAFIILIFLFISFLDDRLFLKKFLFPLYKGKKITILGKFALTFFALPPILILCWWCSIGFLSGFSSNPGYLIMLSMPIVFYSSLPLLFLVTPLPHLAWFKAKKKAGLLLCSECYCRFILGPGLPWLVRHSGSLFFTEVPKKHNSFKDYFVCHECLKKDARIENINHVVIVLDASKRQPYDIEDNILYLNWFSLPEARRKLLFDFGEVHIKSADEFDIEEFVMRVKDDPDDKRRKGYKRILVRIFCELPPGKIFLLKDTFTSLKTELTEKKESISEISLKKVLNLYKL